ncbi:hypothetical protein CEN49_21760 [Fischerella thermalis CCMEE 5273]|nr:hypothetical protein CEN49_21760 [Fischerella thermalis CCMEE 5273]
MCFYFTSLLFPFGVAIAYSDYQPQDRYQAPERYQAPKQYQAPEQYQAPGPYQPPETEQSPEQPIPDNYRESDNYRNSGENNNPTEYTEEDIDQALDQINANRPKPQSPLDTDEYKAYKFTINNIYSTLIQKSADADFDISRFDFEGTITSIGRAGLGIISPNDTAIGYGTNLALDVWSAKDNYDKGKSFFKSARQIEFFWKLRQGEQGFSAAQRFGSFVSDITVNPVSTSTIAGKVSPVLAAVDIGFSAYEGVENLKSGEYNKAVGNLGSMLMSGSTIAAATGAGAPIAAGMFIAGAALWGTSKIIQHKEKIGSFIKNPRRAFNKVTDEVKNIGKGIKKFFGFGK